MYRFTAGGASGSPLGPQILSSARVVFRAHIHLLRRLTVIERIRVSNELIFVVFLHTFERGMLSITLVLDIGRERHLCLLREICYIQQTLIKSRKVTWSQLTLDSHVKHRLEVSSFKFDKLEHLFAEFFEVFKRSAVVDIENEGF